MEYHPLGQTGIRVSAMSLGGAAIGQQYGPVSLDEATDTVHAAIEAGVNLIDTSAFYGRGRSEEALGTILSSSNGLRDRVAICTKAGRIDRAEFDFTPAGMRTSLEGSLRRLRTDHVDILLAHDIEFSNNYEGIFSETADILHRLKQEGKCRFIGMSCYPLGLLRQAIERCQLDVVISYCHYNLQNTRLITDLLPVAESRGVGVLNASPLAMGLLTHQGPPSWHPAPDSIKLACMQAVNVCQKRGVDISYLGMQYCFANRQVSSTITGTARRTELMQNIDAMNSAIDTELLAEVQSLLSPVTDITWPSGQWKA